MIPREQVLAKHCATIFGFGAFSVSESGALVYRSGGGVSNRELVWMDRAGKRLGAVAKPAAVLGPGNLSPDETTVAVGIGIGGIGARGFQSDIWLQDLKRNVLSRFTFRPGISRNPVWSPDGTRLVFALQGLSNYLVGRRAQTHPLPADPFH